jgi:hypothetical protein
MRHGDVRKPDSVPALHVDVEAMLAAPLDRTVGRPAVDDQDLVERRPVDARQDDGDAVALVQRQREERRFGAGSGIGSV